MPVKNTVGGLARRRRQRNLMMVLFFLAVNAHIRHARTNYDELLAKGYDRKHAISLVDDEIQ